MTVPRLCDFVRSVFLRRGELEFERVLNPVPMQCGDLYAAKASTPSPTRRWTFFVISSKVRISVRFVIAKVQDLQCIPQRMYVRMCVCVCVCLWVCMSVCARV